MASNQRLTEGLLRGDLVDIVLPLLSIDQYEAKIDEDAIVVGIFVEDEGAAKDLARFIQRGAYPVIDVDVSPGPDADGYFLVFIEFARNKSFPKNLLSVINDIDRLTGQMDWKFNYYQVPGIRKLDLETLAKYTRITSSDGVRGAAMALTESNAMTVALVGNSIKLTNDIISVNLLIESYGWGEDILNIPSIQDIPVLIEGNSQTYNHLLRLLGRAWSVVEFETGNFLLTKNDGNAILATPIG